MFSIYMAKNAKYTPPYMLMMLVKIKNSHAAYNDHSNNTENQPTVWKIGRDEIL